MPKGHIDIKQHRGKIPAEAVEVRHINRPSVCFYYIDDAVISLEKLDRAWMIQMLKQFKVLGSITWNQITEYKGLGWDCVPQHRMKYTIPTTINRNNLFHIKISGKSRVWGFRDGDVFQIVWFDPEHKVTPE